MFRVNKLADYGTVVMVALTHLAQGLHSAKEIATYTHIPLPTVTKLLKHLAKHGLVHSKLGSMGGYTLAFAPEHISVVQIIEAMNTKVDLIECSTPGMCSLEKFCGAKGNWLLLANSIRDALSTVTLAQLAESDVQFKVNVKIINNEIPIGIARLRT
jgi:FeS assembly SUF system regulator